VNKLLVEFEGTSSSRSGGGGVGVGGTATSTSTTPWDALQLYASGEFGDSEIFPPLGSCMGISEGFLSLGASFMGFGDGSTTSTTTTTTNAILEGVDVPIFLRGKDLDTSSSASSATAGDGDDTNGDSSSTNLSQETNNRNFEDVQQQGKIKSKVVWWEHLSGDYSNMHDWSYLFVPHCTPSDAATTAVNVKAVTKWVTSQYRTVPGGLDALVTVSGGGRIGGCSPSSYAAGFGEDPPVDYTRRSTPASMSSSITALTFAKDVSKAMSSSSEVGGTASSSSSSSSSFKALVVMDGSALWNEKNNDIASSSSGTSLDELVRETLSSNNVDVAWVESTMWGENDAEGEFIREMASSSQTVRNSFHVHRPSENFDATVSSSSSCPLYAFSDASADDAFSFFIRQVVKEMPWGSSSSSNSNNNEFQNSQDLADESERLSFLSIFLILFGGYTACWAVYLSIKCFRQRRSKDAVTPSPHDLWFLALTKFPAVFLLVSVAIPVVLSYLAYERDGVSVNLDFDSYLDIDTKEERTTVQYNTLVDYQQKSLKEEEGHCKFLYSGDPSVYDTEDRALKGETNSNEVQHHRGDYQHRRGLQDYGKRNGRTVISFFYQNRDGGTVFTPDVLDSIREFEDFLMTVPGFDDLCYGDGEICYPLNSITPYFYPDGENLVDDIDSVLKSFPGSKIALAKMDKYFSKKNLGSNVTLTNVMLNDIDGIQRAKVNRFLESLHRVLWRIDQDQKYPDLIISWSNGHMQNVEAADALEHDFKWSLAALTFIGLMVFVKVRNVFVVLAGVLGLVLSFTSAMYWQYHFNFDQLTAMHVAGIFVMLGIGADDIFLTVDSFEHTKVDFRSRMIRDERHSGDGVTGRQYVPNLNDPDIVKQRMVSSYKTAGSMLLVSSVTTAICFFSNVFSALISIADFGSYMGMVVVLNYIHVMTILPSAIIVNEVHIKPVQRKIWGFICCSKNNQREEVREPNRTENLEAETGIAQSVHEDENEEALDDYNFLDHTELMASVDQYFVLHHAPFVYRWRNTVVFASVFVAMILGVLAWLNFTLYDGTIIVFKEQYNLGRVQRVVDEYFPEGVVRKYSDEGLDFVGADTGYSFSAEDVDNSFGGSDVLDVLIDTGGGGPAPTNSATATSPSSATATSPSSATVTSPSTLSPSSRPSVSSSPSRKNRAPSISQEQNATTIAPTLPPTTRPPSPPSPPVTASTPQGEWYPSWTGDTRGCLSDGLQPSYMDDFLFYTKVECCDEYFALDPSPGNCLDMDNYITVFQCDGVDFNSDSSDIIPNTAFHVCIKSMSSHVDIHYLNGMVITQGESDLTMINNAVISFPSFTKKEFAEEHNGVVVSTHVPANVFDYSTAGASTKVTVGVVVKSGISGKLDASEETSFSVDVNLREKMAPQVTSPLPSPTVPGPTAPGPTAPGPTVPGPTVPGPTVPGPTVPGPTVPGPTIPGPIVPGPTISGPSPSQPSTPQSNVSVSSPSPWYPDYFGRVCLNDGLHPSYMDENPGTFLFDKLIECCQINFAGDQSLCLGIDLRTAIPTTSNPTTPPSRNPTLSPTTTVSPIFLPTAASLAPTTPITPSPTTNAPSTSTPPSTGPTLSPVEEETFSCPPGLSGKYCLQTSGAKKTYKKREYFAVALVWGMRPIASDPNIWVVRDNVNKRKNEALDDTLNDNYIDPSYPYIQEWLLEVVTLARNDAALRLHPQPTWIEAVKEFAVENGIGFPVPKDLFIGVLDLMKTQSSFFRKLVERKIATTNPGIHGKFLFTSLSVLSEVPDSYTSELALNDWTNFTSSVNEMLPENLPPINVQVSHYTADNLYVLVLSNLALMICLLFLPSQSDVFMDTLRTTAIVESTLSSYFFANGLYVVIMLFFTGNLLLTLMVMSSLLLILLALAGLTFFAFQIEFGPVESLGVSIFVGLSANYLLHIAHSYHKSNIKERDVKIQRAVFITGSPILWSALSTIGGSMFLFACRTWLLTELGILICTIIGLSLICSVGFLLALLAFIGPLPISPDGDNLHTWDLMIVFKMCCLHKHVRQAECESEIAHVEIAKTDIETAITDFEIAETDVKRPLDEEESISGDTRGSF